MDNGQVMLHKVLLNEGRVLNKSDDLEDVVKRLQCYEEEGAENEARRLLKETVETLSHGENTVLYDNAGIPSVMVRISAMRCNELLEDCESCNFHPAFLAGEKVIQEVWVSKYLNCVVNGRAASLPMCRPQRIGNFDEAINLCRAKGANWLPMPFQLRMAIALWCRRQGFLPTGNNDHGQDFIHPEERGRSLEDGISLTGSGPPGWSHNGNREGIWDLNGNLNEWDSGFRLMNGEIQLIGMGDLLMPDGDFSAESSLWQAMGAKGELLPVGIDDTLHYGISGGGIELSRGAGESGIGNCAFQDIRAQSGLKVPDAVRLWGLFPPAQGEQEITGWRWVDTEGEVMPLCGGAYGAVDHAGIFFAGVTKRRNEDYTLGGVRCVYVDPQALEER